MLNLQLIRDYVLSLEAIRLGVSTHDKLMILVNRFLHASYPLYLMSPTLAWKLLPEPRELIHGYKCKFDDLVFYCPGGNTEIQFLKHFEPAVKRIVGRIRSGDAIDVGANVGLYTVLLSRQLSSEGTVLSIEADPDYFQWLTKNIETNRCSNVIPIGMAAWSAEEELRLIPHRFGGSPLDSRLSQSNQTLGHRVRGTPLDVLVQQTKLSPALIKIDAEGAEYEVLLGARNTLQSNKPFIIFEGQEKEKFSKCVTMLREFGYNVKRLHDGNFLGEPNSSGDSSRS